MEVPICTPLNNPIWSLPMETLSPNGPGTTTVLSPSAGSCLSPDASSIGMSLSTLSVATLGAEWGGCGQMNSDGLVMAAQRSPCTTTLFSSTRTYLLLRLWQLSGRLSQEMHRLKLIMPVVARPITLRRCFRTRIRGTIWEAWSTSHVRRNVIIFVSSELLQRSRNKEAVFHG